MQITHLGHSCLLVESGGVRALLDPGSFSDIDSVADVDAVIVTHQHPDHLDQGRLGGLLHRNPKASVLADPQSAQLLRQAVADEGTGQEVLDLADGSPVELGALTVRPSGALHAVIHDRVPQVTNVGVLLTAAGEPSLFHPGDALDAQPGQVDLLAVPVNAPWCAVKETIGFVRRIAPAGAIPIHDALLGDTGRAMYLNHISRFSMDGLQVHDLRGAGAVEL